MEKVTFCVRKLTRNPLVLLNMQSNGSGKQGHGSSVGTGDTFPGSQHVLLLDFFFSFVFARNWI
jgi:hypothetical protein